jgi:hypothetical protein
MQGARDFARRTVFAALGLERADLAVMLALKVDQRPLAIANKRGTRAYALLVSLSLAKLP